MAHFILVREYRRNDEATIREIVRSSNLSLVTDSFVNSLTKEVTFQLIVLMSAVMFIFIGLPMTYCIISVPLVLAIIYSMIYSSYLFKSIEVFQGDSLKCWVAEVCEPFFYNKTSDKIEYAFITERDLIDQNIDIGALRRKVIGTVAVNRHMHLQHSLWLYRLAVQARYRRKGVGCALIQAAVNWSRRDHDFLELVITECQETARKLFINLGFQLRQMYHKQIIGSALTVLKYQLSLELKKS